MRAYFTVIDRLLAERDQIDDAIETLRATMPATEVAVPRGLYALLTKEQQQRVRAGISPDDGFGRPD